MNPLRQTVTVIFLCMLGWSHVTAGEPTPAKTENEVQPRAAHAKEPAPPGAAGDWVVIEEQDWVRMMNEPSDHLNRAFAEFQQSQPHAAACELRKAAVYIQISAGRATNATAEALRISAAELNQLADDVDKGLVRSVDALERVFARAHQALAQHDWQEFNDSLHTSRSALSGSYLDSAANHTEQAFKWLHYEENAARTHAVGNARQLARQLTAEPAAARGQTAQTLEQLGEQLKLLGKSIAPSTATPPPSPAASPPRPSATASQVPIEKDYLVKFAAQPGHHIEAARLAFDTGDLALAEGELRKAAAFLRVCAADAVGSLSDTRDALAAAARDLDRLAADIEAGKTVPRKTLEATIARAFHATADYHQMKAQQSWIAKDWEAASEYLGSAIHSVGQIIHSNL